MKQDNYLFNVEVAKKYGVNEAIFLQNMKFWISSNKANGRNFKEGRYWTYNSYEAFQEIFPFWTARQIRTIIDKLVEQGVILKENKFNKQRNDHTNWYAFVNEDEWINVQAPKEFCLTNLSDEDQETLWSDQNVKQNEEKQSISISSDENVKQNEDLLDKKVSPLDEKVKSDLTNMSEHYHIYTHILNTDVVEVLANFDIEKICFDFNDTNLVNEKIRELFRKYVNTLKPHWSNEDMIRNELLFDPRPELNYKVCWIIILKAFMEYPSWNKQFQNVKSLVGKIKKLKEKYLENLYKTKKQEELREATIQRNIEYSKQKEISFDDIEKQLHKLKEKLNQIKNEISGEKYNYIVNLIEQRKWMQAQTELLELLENE